MTDATKKEIPSFDMMVIKRLNDYLYVLIRQLIGFSPLSTDIIKTTITLKNDEIGHSLHVHGGYFGFRVYGDPELFIELLSKMYVCKEIPKIIYQSDHVFRYLFSCMHPSDKISEYLNTTDIGIIVIHENNKSYEIIHPCDYSKDLNDHKIAKLRGPKISKSLAVNLVSNGLNLIRSEYLSDKSKWSLE